VLGIVIISNFFN